jgi:hypothetical protein
MAVTESAKHCSSLFPSLSSAESDVHAIFSSIWYHIDMEECSIYSPIMFIFEMVVYLYRFSSIYYIPMVTVNSPSRDDKASKQ